MDLSSDRDSNIKLRKNGFDAKGIESQGGMNYGSTAQYAGSKCKQNVRNEC